MSRLLTVEEAARWYDAAVEWVDEYTRVFDPCLITSKEDCNGTSPTFCCTDCKNLTDSGCGVVCLRCKTFFCGETIYIFPPYIRKEVMAIRTSTFMLFPGARESREESLRLFGNRLHGWSGKDIDFLLRRIHRLKEVL